MGFARLEKVDERFKLISFDTSGRSPTDKPYVWGGNILCISMGTDLLEFHIGYMFNAEEVALLVAALRVKEVELRWE